MDSTKEIAKFIARQITNRRYETLKIRAVAQSNCRLVPLSGASAKKIDYLTVYCRLFYWFDISLPTGTLLHNSDTAHQFIECCESLRAVVPFEATQSGEMLLSWFRRELLAGFPIRRDTFSKHDMVKLKNWLN